MATPTSEPTGDDPSRDAPDAYLTSGEEVFWSEPREARQLQPFDGSEPRGLLGLRLDPPAIGQSFGLGGRNIDLVVVTPVDPRQSVRDGLPALPLDVHLLLPPEEWDPGRPPDPAALRLIGRGKLVASLGAARATDASMIRMNGPRR